jgi:hypothetical protein
MGLLTRPEAGADRQAAGVDSIRQFFLQPGPAVKKIRMDCEIKHYYYQYYPI